ncbi:cytochrome c oxidase assembly protein COX18, mitochondrial-like [Ornithodoros turicata]|uniref:cytochrome c oxidase assembly protein COX18, mitochondrial-like n=1 Tax=Ornithodoros turicata TaxID=34597 RepID=UPI00313A0EA7
MYRTVTFDGLCQVRKCVHLHRQFSAVTSRKASCLLNPPVTSSNSKNNVHRRFSFESWALALSRSEPVAFAQQLLEYVHLTTGMSWCHTIILTSLALRTVTTFPLAIYQNHVLARLRNLNPEIAKLVPELRNETNLAVKMFKLSEKRAKLLYKHSLKKQINKLIIRDNCHPFKSTVVMLVQIPVWISFSVALRNMAFMMPYQDMAAQALFLELSVGGALWFTNLTVPDPLFIMPVLLGAVNLLNIEMNALKRAGNITRYAKVVTNVFRVLSLVMIPIASMMPSDVALYWLCSSGFALGQNVALTSPSFRRFCRIPVVAGESQTPFQDICQNLKKRLRLKAVT